MTYEPLSPVAVEQKLRALVTEMTKAQQMLARARDAECDAEIALAKARDAVAKAAPKVTRGEFTVGEREEFIEVAVRDEWEALRRAEKERKNSEDYLRIVREQASVVQTLARGVQQAYSMAGAA